MWLLDNFNLNLKGYVLAMRELLFTNNTLSPIGMLLIITLVFGTWLLIFLFLSKERNKVASLVVASRLRSISEIAKHASMTEGKVVKILRILASGSSGVSLNAEAKDIKGAKIDLKKMKISLRGKEKVTST
jgi:hypothetical protein